MLPILALALLWHYAAADSLIDEEFCQHYYPKGIEGIPPCEQVMKKVRSNMSRPLPTLEMGDPSKPAMFFIHGWPDSAAEWAPQFAHFCFSGRFFCVAPTWQNFHPDLPAAAVSELTFNVTIVKLVATMREAHLKDTTLVIHDFGAALGYYMMPAFPDLISRVIAFDIGSCLTVDCSAIQNLTYQAENRAAWISHDSSRSMGSATYWRAPCIDCATWRTTWAYNSTLAYRNLWPHKPGFGPIKPFMFLWGNMFRGKPRGNDSKFFDQSWLNFVNSWPHGRTVEVPSDHWMHVKAPIFVNDAIDSWLKSLPTSVPVVV